MSSWLFGNLGIAGILGAGIVAAVGLHPAVAGASTPTLTVTPGPPFHSGETVNVSVGPNTVFTPFARVNILECADPGGSAANLPKDDTTCDGNTIQGDSLIVRRDGGFSEQSYTLYQLPSTALGEQPDFQPVCNATNPCVLFVGQDQNDFTQPKLFSTPFSIADGGPSAAAPVPAPTLSASSGAPGPATGVTGKSASSGSSLSSGDGPTAPVKATASAAASQTAGPGTLAFTGVSAAQREMAVIGAVLLLGGVALLLGGAVRKRRVQRMPP